MSRLLPLALLLVGCGGRDSSHEDGPLPLSPYGDLRLSKTTDFGGTTTPFDFVLFGSALTGGTLTIGNTHETAEAASRTVEIVLKGYAGTRGRGYSVAKGEAVLRLHEPGLDGPDRAWIATGGRIVDAGQDQQRRLLRVEAVTVAAVDVTGATGTAQLDGSLHIDLFGG